MSTHCPICLVNLAVLHGTRHNEITATHMAGHKTYSTTGTRLQDTAGHHIYSTWGTARHGWAQHTLHTWHCQTETCCHCSNNHPFNYTTFTEPYCLVEATDTLSAFHWFRHRATINPVQRLRRV
jgi:hypothetical protein